MAAVRCPSCAAFPRTACAFFLFVLALNPSILPAEREASPPSLAKILEKVAGYCRLFESASLNYVCIEDAREIIYMPYYIAGTPTGRTQSLRHRFTYDYQLIRKGGEITEQRRLQKGDRIAQTEETAPFKLVRFKYRHIILGPLILSEDSQRYHDYRIAGREKVGQEECTVLAAAPKPSAPTGNLYGKAWIREQDGRIMKLEWDQQSILNFDTFVATGRNLGATPRITLTMEFLFEKNGIGFPSRCRMSEDYIKDSTDIRLSVSETTVTYRDYKFFTVETEVKENK